MLNANFANFPVDRITFSHASGVKKSLEDQSIVTSPVRANSG